MMSRSLIRRLQRLETRLGVHRTRNIRIEFYDRSLDGTLIRRPHSDDDPTEAQGTIRVVFVKAAAGNQPLKSVGPDPRPSGHPVGRRP